MVRCAAGAGSYTGQCSLHRGQIMRLRGAYDEALAEFAHAQRRYEEEGTVAPAGMALTEQGDVLRIRGSSTRLRRRTGRRPSTATSRNQDLRWPGWLAVGRRRRSRLSADSWPRRKTRFTGPGCSRRPWRS